MPVVKAPRLRSSVQQQPLQVIQMTVDQGLGHPCIPALDGLDQGLVRLPRTVGEDRRLPLSQRQGGQRHQALEKLRQGALPATTANCR